MQGMTETQLLTVGLANLPTAIVVLTGILINNHRLNNLRDLMRAEMAKNHREMLAKFTDRLEQQRWKP
ncbi:MAG: hypothetical protein ACR2NN_17665 [Bryobacteraceae bacterium]